MMKLRLLLLGVGLAGVLSAQTDLGQDTSAKAIARRKAMEKRFYDQFDPKPWSATITKEDLTTLVTTLAGKEMEGRETGEEGQRRAAAFIADQFKTAGLPPLADRKTFFQQIWLQKESWNEIGVKAGEQELRYRTDFYLHPAYITNEPILNLKEVVFVGYGIEDGAYNDYQKADVEGKAVIFYDGEPMDAEGKSLITGSDMRSQWSLDWKKKARLAKQKGAVAAFIIDSRFEENLKNNRKLTGGGGWKPAEKGSEKAKSPAAPLVNCLFVSPPAAKAILGDKASKVEEELSDLRGKEKFKPVKIKNKIEIRLDKKIQTLEGSNVLGVIEGSDETLKKEFVFITAHYDHLGMADSTVIYHGADDNASGTAAVIEIARAFYEAKKQGKGPKRTVVCMLVSGEEKGLLGSKFYVEFPLFSLEKTVAEINIDMIGRVDPAHADNPNYIYVIGSDRLSSELHQINEKNNEWFTQLELNYKYNAKDDPNHFYERSDHYNFAERGIPSIFYFNGTHADYHRPSDTIEKINFDALTKRAHLAFYTAWEIANRPLRLQVDKK